ncbi:MAG: DNA-directed RNA polymerase, subunit E'' [Methanosarcinales archaeon]|nr:DNA-directed RNA polymerase, subunit E'' [Methanosarcinales archaeon]
MSKAVCRECHRLVDGQVCPVCGSNSLSTDWSGYLVVTDPELSKIASAMNIKSSGKYCLKVR